MQPILANQLLQGVGSLSENPAISAVVTDSRAAQAGSLFVCIKGERVDGHDFAAKAIAQGAAGIVAQHAVDGVPPEKTVLVSDVLDALIAMGGNYRDGFSPCLVGVTGSVGKTSTKRALATLLSQRYRVRMQEGNHNSEISVPMAILGILPQAMVADVAEYDSILTKENREGMFYAARTFAFKLGQSVALLLFTSLAKIGSDGMGYRISALIAGILCLLGGFALMRYDEKTLFKSLAEKDVR